MRHRCAAKRNHGVGLVIAMLAVLGATACSAPPAEPVAGSGAGIGPGIIHLVSRRSGKDIAFDALPQVCRIELCDQRDLTVKLIDRRKQTFLTRYGTAMPEDNVWLSERSTEQSALARILVALDSPTTQNGAAVRGAGMATADAPRNPGEGS